MTIEGLRLTRIAARYAEWRYSASAIMAVKRVQGNGKILQKFSKQIEILISYTTC